MPEIRVFKTNHWVRWVGRGGCLLTDVTNDSKCKTFTSAYTTSVKVKVIKLAIVQQGLDFSLVWHGYHLFTSLCDIAIMFSHKSSLARTWYKHSIVLDLISYIKSGMDLIVSFISLCGIAIMSSLAQTWYRHLIVLDLISYIKSGMDLIVSFVSLCGIAIML